MLFSGENCKTKILKPGAVPSQFRWTKTRSPAVIARHDRAKQKERSNNSSPAIFLHQSIDACDLGAEVEVGATDNEVLQNQQPTIAAPTTTTVGTMTEPISANTFPSFSEKKSYFSIEMLMENDEALHFFTGLENSTKFNYVFQSLGPTAYKLNYFFGQVSKPKVEYQFLLVLMKLRQRKCNYELALMFGIDEKAVYNIFVTWVRFMALQWREIDLWPSKDLVQFYSPEDFFDKFPDTRVVLDGTECPVKQPKQPVTQQATFSRYKNRNTVKVVVGSTPGGLVSHVSPAYGGSVSDRHIIERSDIPKMCNPGDSIMADKGFEVQDLFAPHDVTVNIPTFFKKTNRLSGKAVLSDRKIASKRVHIERIIGLGKTYKILTSPLGHAETQLASDIIFICFMLCNFRSCIVPTTA